MRAAGIASPAGLRNAGIAGAGKSGGGSAIFPEEP